MSNHTRQPAFLPAEHSLGGRIRAWLFRAAAILCIIFTFSFSPARGNLASFNSLVPDRWKVECVDCRKQFPILGEHSLRVDASDNPHVAYGGDNLYYATKDAQGWHLTTVDYGGGDSASLALDASGAPQIAYSAGGWVKLAVWDGKAWGIQNIVEGSGRYFSLALDEDSVPWIAYYDPGVMELRVASRPSGEWSTMTIDSLEPPAWGGDSELEIRGISLALDSHGYARVGYLKAFSGAYYAAWDGTDWQITDLPEVRFSHGGLSLAIDALDQPHLAYYVDDPSDQEVDVVKYTWAEGGVWREGETIDTFDYWNIPLAINLALSPSGVPVVGYIYDRSDGVSMMMAYQVKVAWKAGDTWVKQDLVSDDYGGTFVSLALDPAGAVQAVYTRRAVTHINWRGGDLLYSSQNAGWIPEKIDESDFLGALSEVALAVGPNGRPQVVYEDYTRYQVLHAERNGSLWANEIATSPAHFETSAEMGVDASNQTHLIYTDANTFIPGYAMQEDGLWSTRTIPGASSGSSELMAIDTGGYPHLM